MSSKQIPVRSHLERLKFSMVSVVVAVALFSVNQRLEAGFIANPTPDILVNVSSVTYNTDDGVTASGDRLLKVSGWAISLNQVSTGPVMFYQPGTFWGDLDFGPPAAFSMTAQINPLASGRGELVAGTASFSVDANNPMNSTVVPLLSGSITELDDAAFLNNGAIEFLASTNLSAGNSQLEAIFGPEIVIKLGLIANNLSFANFFKVSNVSADIRRPVPEPTSGLLWLSGMGAFAFARRRRQS